jgi:hypothetical protein
MKTVEIKKGKKNIQGTLHKGILSLPNELGESVTEIAVEGKTYMVTETRVDDRDDLIYLTLDVPDGTGAKANEQSTKGNT